MRQGVHAIVLDGNQRSALAATRSLGRAGLRVVVADHTPMMLAAASKHCLAAGSYPDPAGQRSRLVAAVVARQAGMAHAPYNPPPPVVIACSDPSLPPLLEADASACLGPMCVPGAAAYPRRSDKWTLFQLSHGFGLPTPDIWLACAAGTASAVIVAGSNAEMVKQRASVLDVGGVRRKLPVLLLLRSALADLLAGDTYPACTELLVQTLVPGDGVGVSALCADGQAVRWFAYCRLREKPPSGGVSTLGESIGLPTVVRDYCERLNDRYVVGRRLRWLMGDLGYLYLVLRDRSVDPCHPSRLPAVRNFLAVLPCIAAIEDWRYGDWRPSTRQVAAEFCR